MDVSMVVIIAVVAFVILAIGGGGGYWFWLSTRPKKMSWQADVYQLGDGVMPPIKHKGKIMADYRLSDLKPFTRDVVEKVDKKSGATHYWLQRLKKAVPVVTADCVEVWGQNQKRVRILLEGDTCTLLKPAYDRKIGSIIFRPMPHDRINMIKTEIEERKDRIENTKDILAQITPFIVVGVTMLALVIITYFLVQGAIKIGEMNVEITTTLTDSIESFKKDLFQSMNCVADGDLPQITKEKPPEIPP